MTSNNFFTDSICIVLLCCLNFSNVVQASYLYTIPLSVKKIIEHTPLGDSLHVEVYDFIVKELLEKKCLSQQEIKKILDEERAIFQSKEPLKPYEANISEESFSHILNALCSYHKKCQAICVYKKDGLAIGITSFNKNFNKIRNKESYAILSDAPLSKVGLRLIKKIGNTKYYEAIQLMYLQNNIAHLSLQKDLHADQKPIGYVRYIFTN